MLDLRHALTAFAKLKSPGKISAYLAEHGRHSLADLYEELDNETRDKVDQQSESLDRMGVGVFVHLPSDFPDALVVDGRPLAPIVFHWGNPKLLDEPSIAIAGARSAEKRALDATRACAKTAVDRGFVVVSGYAKGVDTVAHLAALESGGRTAAVLAEGFNHFKVKEIYREHFDQERVVVLSQFAPAQPWRAHAAMTRNKVVYGMSRALLVVEAGESGGTLAAGEGALAARKPVYVVDFGDETLAGSRLLVRRGAVRVRYRSEFDEVLTGLLAAQESGQQQLY
ncbi:DNA-processing protein DprA [Actinosynnema sp. CA-299493]